MGIINEILELRKSFTLTDKQLIGDLLQEIDDGKDFVSGDNNYVWFYLLSSVVKPKTIIEMGSRFGYSLKCFVEGAGHSIEDYTIHSFDLECDGIETLEIMKNYFTNVIGIKNLIVHKVDTQSLQTLNMDNQCDLCLVDGMHTIEGCFHECKLAWDALKKGGIMAIDDYHENMPKEGLIKFCKEYNLTYEVIDSFRGMAIIIK